MKKNIILIDYENVQKFNLLPLLNHDVMIKVFHNENQKFSSEFTNAAINFGKEKIELVKIKGQGKNALDFHIAYYIGKLSNEQKDVFFHIISKDTGFQPLVDYLKKEEKILCLLEKDISDIPILKPVEKLQKKNLYDATIAAIKTRKSPKAKRKTTLRNQIISIWKKEINESDAESIINEMIKKKFILCENEKITYNEC